MSFKYKEGERVDFKYDPSRGVVEASKGPEKYELKTVPGSYRICVFMGDKGDRVRVEMK